MIDELDLAFEDHAQRGRPRHRRGSRAKDPGGRGGRSAVAFLMALLLLGVLGAGAWYGYDKVKGFFTAADYDGQGTGEVTVSIPTGASLTEIGNELVEAGVVKSTAAFVDAAEANSRSKNIQAGSYKLRSQMSAAAALAAMLNPDNRVVNRVTIPEGKTAKDIYKLLSSATGIPVKDFEQAAKDPEALGVPDFWFKRDDGQKVTKSIEGFLFPETYELDPKAAAADHLREMVQQFLAVAEEIRFVDTVQDKRKITPYEALIVASLAEAEAGTKKDLGKVARVAYNRVYNEELDFFCRCLEFDVGINYYYQLTGKPTKPSKDMTDAELTDPKNPYRTHGKPGLTPTPINNPGKAAMQGAMDPPVGDWLYFVAIDKDGNSAFATTLAEHNRNIARAKKAGIL